MHYETILPAELIAKAQEGDEEAFAEIYEQTIGPVYRFALFRTGETRSAEQVTEEIFLKVWKNFRKFDLNGKTAFPVWMFQIVHQTVTKFLEEFRKMSLERRRMLQERDVIISGPEAEYRNLLDAFQEIPVAQTDAVILKYFGHLSNLEIALILEKTEGAIRILQSRGLKKLRELLEQKETPSLASTNHD